MISFLHLYMIFLEIILPNQRTSPSVGHVMQCVRNRVTRDRLLNERRSRKKRQRKTICGKARRPWGWFLFLMFHSFGESPASSPGCASPSHRSTTGRVVRLMSRDCPLSYVERRRRISFAKWLRRRKRSPKVPLGTTARGDLRRYIDPQQS